MEIKDDKSLFSLTSVSFPEINTAPVAQNRALYSKIES